MSDLRTAAQQALEALRPFVRGNWTPGLAVQAAAAMDRLEDALAEPDDEPTYCPTCGEEDGGTTCGMPNCGLRCGAEPVQEPEPPPEAQTEAEKVAYCAGWWAALEQARKEEPVMKPAGVITSMVKGGVTWHIWPDQMPDGTTLYAAAPIIKPEIKEDKPFGYFRAEPFGWTDCAPTDEGAIPLYDRPQAQQFLCNAWADEQIQKEKK